MVLINLGTLSDEGIRYIARQENLEDWETLSRDELIENLEELYEDNTGDKKYSESVSRKYVSGLTGSDSDVSSFPGVVPVSCTYNETYIHLVPRDANWVYAFWEISENKLKEITAEKRQLAIIVKALKTKKLPEESYEININNEDTDWSIELPWTCHDYVLSLVSKKDDSSETLCSTEKYYVPQIHIKEHPEDLHNPDRFHILVSPMLGKDNNLIENPTVREIVRHA